MEKGRLMRAVVIIGTALAAPAYAQSAGTATVSTTGVAPELRVAAFVVPPLVMEQNGSLTGFNIDLWNAIAARLNRKTIYQIAPDVSALEEAMRSKRADLTLALLITSARDEVFDFSLPTLQAGLQIMVRDTHQTAATVNPLWDIAVPDIFANDSGVVRHGPVAGANPRSRGLAARRAARGRCDFEPKVLPRHI